MPPRTQFQQISLMCRRIMVALLAVMAVPVVLAAQLNYTHSTLVHGWNDTEYRFLTPNTPGLLSRDMNLKQVQTPRVDGTLGIYARADILRQHLYGSHVLTGLSMGGLASRAAYDRNPNNIAAIITIATPHQGAPIADNADRVTTYGANLVVDFFGTVIAIFYKAKHNSILSAVAAGLINDVARSVLTEVVKVHLDQQVGANNQARHDQKTSSPTIAALNSKIDALPHANVYGTIPRRNAVFRLGFSAFYNDAGFEPFVKKKNKVKSVVKACRQIAWNIIVRLEVGRVCNQIDRALGSIDGRWAEWTMGAEARNANATFDGFVPTSRSRYPGSSLTDPINFHASQTNHMNIQYKREGTDAIVRGMVLVGMERVTPPDGGGEEPPPEENQCPPPELVC